MKTKIGIAAVLAALLLPSASGAAVWNPGFEFGLANWNPTGDSSLENGTYGASNRLVLTSESAGQNPLGTGALDVATLLGVTGMSAAALDAAEPAGFNADTGSVVEQDFSYAWAGTATLSFDWQLFTDETLWGGGTPFADYALIRVFEQAGPFDTYEVVGDIETEFLGGNLVASGTQYDTQSAINTFTLTALLPNPGDYTLQIVMFDVEDDEFSSAVALDNFTLVPEPATLALCAAGILGLLVAGSGRRRERQGLQGSPGAVRPRPRRAAR